MAKNHRVNAEMDIAREKFLDATRNGATYAQALKASGISYCNMSVWKKRMSERDVLFFKRWDEALRARARHNVTYAEESLYKQAKKGNIAAIRDVLFNHAPQRWKSETEIADTKNASSSGSLEEIEKLPYAEQERELLSRIVALIDALVVSGKGDSEKKGGK